MKKPACPGRRFAGALFPVLAIAVSPLWAGPVYSVKDGGVTRQYEVVDDEVSVFRKTGKVAAAVSENLNGAVILKDFGSRAIVRFPKVNWKTVVGPRTLGGAEFEPVIYELGKPRKDTTRRVVTPQVLASGAAEAELLKVSGAASAKVTTVEGHVMLTFPSATDALGGVEKLRAAGMKAEPQLRRKLSKRAVPNDLFFGDQWHLQNTGQGNGVPGVDVNPILAWDTYTGAGVTIAVVDDGIDLAHEDLAPNLAAVGVGGPHHDWNDDDDDPSPQLGDDHGTAVAGVASARGDNGLGVSGAAQQANLIGLRLTSADVTDLQEQEAFLWNGGTAGTQVDISNNSWGPDDFFVDLNGPGLLALDGLRLATTNGRGGLGTVFVWAAGNGGEIDDNVNTDGYANSRFVIAVGAVANNGTRASYSELGAPLLVSAPSDGGLLGITTTDRTGDLGYNSAGIFGESPDVNYTNSFGGTSSAAPLVSGVAALMLEANPDLGYRDVMEIIGSTASRVDSTNAEWATNGAGFQFNHNYGGGMVDATAAVIRAEDWVNLGPQVQVERALVNPAVPAQIPDATTAGVARDFNFANTDNLRVEHVEVQLDISHAHRSDLAITVTSPSGHVSRLMEKRNRPLNGEPDVDYTDGGLGWTFSTVQHWGENSQGTWTVRISDTTPGTQGSLVQARMRVFGTPAVATRFTFDKKFVAVGEAGGQIVIPVRRLNDVAGEATVDYSISAMASATDTVDFTGSTGTLTFPDGVAVQNITIPILQDAVVEADERFHVVLRNPSVGTLGGITVQTVEIDDDEGNAVSVVATDAEAAETNLTTEPANNGVFTISRRVAAPTPLTVKFALTQPPPPPAPAGSLNYAANELDYNELPFQAIIPPFATSVTVTVVPKNDRFSEGTELVELTLIADAAYNIGIPNSAIVTIIDNDLVPVSVTSSVASVVESSGTEIVFTVLRDTDQLDAPLNIFLEPTGTASPGVDYDPPFPSVVTIPAGKATTTVSIRPNDNSVFNPMKTVVLGVSQGPEYKEGFFRTVEVRIFDDEPVPDKVKPAVSIAAPLKAQRINSPDAILASGTATDNPDAGGNTNAAQVRFRLNQGAWNVATLTNTNWDADITMHSRLGTNQLDVYSIDEAGNESPVSSVMFDYVKLRGLTTTVTGPGTITADFTGARQLEVGQPYTIVAKPTGATSLFDGWSGAFVATTKPLSFVMPDADIALTATFASSLINEAVVGKFAGLVSTDLRKTRGIAFDITTSGYFEASITKTGKLVGKLTYGGLVYPVRGDVTASGAYLGEIPRKKNTPLALRLQLDTDILGSKTLSGVVSADGRDSGILCPKLLTKAEAATATAGIAGKYTLQMPMSDLITQAKPQGTGVATMTLDASGRVKWIGTLPDGTPASQTAYLSKDKTWPLFVNLYKGRGVILGTMLHDNLPLASDISGTVDWGKIGDQRDKLFPGGFTISRTAVSGSLYTPPVSGQRVLSAFALGNGTLFLEEGNFRSSFPVKSVGITDRNKLTIAPAGSDRLELSVSTATGALKGSFIHPITLRKTKITGVVFQKTGRAYGQFIGSTPTSTALQTGRLLITPPSSN